MSINYITWFIGRNVEGRHICALEIIDQFHDLQTLGFRKKRIVQRMMRASIPVLRTASALEKILAFRTDTLVSRTRPSARRLHP